MKGTTVTAGGSKPTILVIDDEVLIRMMVVDELMDAGYECEEASSGAEGLAALDGDRPFDLMITDIGLPDGPNGIELAERARALRPGIKVVLMTGYADASSPAAGDEVLVKPFEVAHLVERVDALLRNGRA